MMKLVMTSLLIMFMSIALTACSPKIGSKEWCAAMKKKDKGEWTTNEVKDFAKHCLF